MNKTFLYGLFAGFCLISVYKTTHILLDKTKQEQVEEVPLTLLDINFTASSKKDLPEYAIKKHGDKDENFKLADFKGKPMIVHFWATWCQPCKKELPFYDKFIAAHPEIVHIALTPDGTPKDKVIAFFSKEGLKNIPVMTDDAGIVSKAMDAKALPTTVFVDKDGIVLGKVTGIIDWQDAKVAELVLKTLKG